MKVADMHCDTISALLEENEKGAGWTLGENGLHLNLEKMRQGDYLLQNFALFVYLGSGKDPYLEAKRLADCFSEQMRLFPDRIRQVYRYADIAENAAAGRISAVLTIEEGAACQGSLEKLREFYDMGVRMLTLTWNFPNELGYPNVTRPETPGERPDFRKPQTELGLTETGRIFVEEMQRLGMVVDVSHLSDAGFWDVVSCAKKPFAASHSNARGEWNHIRNLTDEMIRALAEKGGVTGLNFCPDFLEDVPEDTENVGSLAAVVRHARHIVNAGGIECLGLGSDFDGIPTHGELTGGDKMPLLDDALAKAGFTASQREKIFSGNVLRLYRDCFAQ